EPATLGRIEEGRLFGPDWLRALGAIPNEYLFYYYATREAVAAVRDRGSTRGEFLARQQEAFYAAVSGAPNAGGDPEWAAAGGAGGRAGRAATYRPGAGRDAAAPGGPSGGGYEQVARGVMRALAGGPPATLVLNVRNRGALAGLDPAAVVEVPCLVDGNGAHPLVTAPLPDHAGGLVPAARAVERATIEAALTGSRAAALRAFALPPLVDSVAAARRLLAGYAAAHPELAHLAGP